MSDTATQSGLVVTRVPIGSIFPDPANSNTHDEADIVGLMAKLSTFTQVEPLVVQAKTRKVIGGNGRIEAMRRLGWEECDVCLIDVDNVTATAMGISLNTRKSKFDDAILAQHLRALQSEDFALDAVGFTDDEVDKLIERLGDALVPDFQPAGIEDQGKLDEKAKVECPDCGCKFTP